MSDGTRGYENTTWTPERIAQLKRALKKGLSAKEIAAVLGGFENCKDGGRSAVLGKIHRLRNRNVIPSSTLRAEQAKARKADAQIREAAKRARREARQRELQEHTRDKVLRYVNRGHHLLLCETLADQELAPSQFDLSIPQEQRKTILELENHHCRFPIGEVGNPNFFYCGDPTADVLEGRPYCAVHAARSFTAPKPHRRTQNRSDATRHYREEAA